MKPSSCLRQASVLAMTLALATACNGGGSGGMVYAPPPPAPPPPAPPPPDSASGPCPDPIHADCVVEGRHTASFDEYGMRDGRTSNHRLYVHGGDRGGGWVNLKAGEYRFAGGTEIAGTTLVLWDRLVSDVQIHRDYTGLGFIGESELWLLGTVRGNVMNAQRLNLRCWSGIHACASIGQQRIEGNYLQLEAGALETVLGRHLEITGTATLAGRLVLARGDAGYVLPTAPASVLVLRADGGVQGAFGDWSPDGLFLEGALRYGANEVFFDLTRVSLQAAAAANGMRDRLRLATAGNLDRALSAADRFAMTDAGELDDGQRRFLRSAASLLWLRDPAQAERSLASLSGHAHAAVVDTLHRANADATAQLDARLSRLQHAAAPVAWVSGPRGPSAQGVVAESSGFDHWLGPRLVVGGGLRAGRLTMRYGQDGGSAWGESPGAGLHLHWRGDGWHATGALGATRSRLWLRRPIESGDGRAHEATSQRRLAQTFLHGELARRLELAGGRMEPFLALDYDRATGDAFLEHGDTGFELMGDRSRRVSLSAAVGARFERSWGGNRQVRFEADARYRHDMSTDVRSGAAFRGVPDVRFDLQPQDAPAAGSVRLGLSGPFARDARWSIDVASGFGRGQRDAGWMLGIRRGF